jgi:hypothetical protein
VLFVASLPWLFLTFNLPNEVESETTVLSYEHQGGFDYIVHLKPSYLFGPPPQQLPPNPRYPARIVETIDFTYTYSPTLAGPEVVYVDAILENPGVWQKKVRLVPDTEANGDFNLRFKIDITEINGLFDSIEEEIQIASSPRHLTLNACVSSPKEQFIHSLPIQLTDTIIEVEADLRHNQACGVGVFDYVVKLKDNSIFEAKTLEPPPFTIVSTSTTLGPGQVIFPKLVETMDVTFDYSFKSDKPITKITSNVGISVFLRAIRGEDTELWSKKFFILHTKKYGDFNISFPLNLIDYLEFSDIVEDETGVRGNNLTITSDIHTVAETSFGLIDETFSQAMKGTLSGNTIEWDEDLIKAQPGMIKKTEVIPNTSGYLGLSVNQTKAVSISVVVVFFLLLLLSAVLYTKFRSPELSWIQKKLRQNSKKYGEIIAEAKIEDGRNVTVASIEDLTKVANELGKPIIYQAPGAVGEPHSYYVFDGEIRYQYLLGINKNDWEGSDGGVEQL